MDDPDGVDVEFEFCIWASWPDGETGGAVEDLGEVAAVNRASSSFANLASSSFNESFNKAEVGTAGSVAGDLLKMGAGEVGVRLGSVDLVEPFGVGGEIGVVVDDLDARGVSLAGGAVAFLGVARPSSSALPLTVGAGSVAGSTTVSWAESSTLSYAVPFTALSMLITGSGSPATGATLGDAVNTSLSPEPLGNAGTCGGCCRGVGRG